MDSATGALNPFCGCTVITVDAVPPGAIVGLGLDAASVNVGGSRITNGRVIFDCTAPEVPLMVMEAVPVLAVAAAVRVMIEVEPALAEVNDAVTPVGRPLAESVTLPANPPMDSMRMGTVAVDPGRMAIVVGGGTSEIPGGGVTVIARLALAVTPLPVPVRVTVKRPGMAVLAAVNVTGIPFAEAAPMTAVTPAGRVLRVTVTVPLKPFCGVTLMVVALPVAPCVSVRAAGEAAIVKLGGGTNVSPTVTVSFRVPDVPAIARLAV
jgi:hypothetical protein